jgi:hypothetical protein
MHTTKLSLAETRSVSIAAPPAVVLEFVADPRRLPEWAPEFARAVRPDGTDWLIDTGDREARITVRVSPDHGTMDLLAASAPAVGAFTRVLPNRNGAEYQFTLLFPSDTPTDAIARQMESVEQELETVRMLCEVEAAADAA